MPQDALPVPPPPIRPNLERLIREYLDPLLRPMSGTVTIRGSETLREGAANIIPVAVKVKLLNGVLDVLLPPDTYTLEADLWTIEDQRVSDTQQVILTRSR